MEGKERGKGWRREEMKEERDKGKKRKKSMGRIKILGGK